MGIKSGDSSRPLLILFMNGNNKMSYLFCVNLITEKSHFLSLELICHSSALSVDFKSE